MKRSCLTLFLALAMALALLGSVLGTASADQKLPVKGMVTLVDLGSPQCLPCRLMMPVIEEVKEQYQGKAAVVYLDVWENPGLASHYGIRAIPTQVFYDEKGREVFRHEGFLSKEQIQMVLSKMGVATPPPASK